MSVTIPESLVAALAILADDPETTVLAGGTDLMVEVNDGRRDPARVLVVARLPELRGVRIEGGELVVGAAATYTELMQEPVRSAAPALAFASRTIGSPQIRNAGTIGGNLGTSSPAGDCLPVLVALDAIVEVASAAGTRAIPIRDFCTGPKRNALQPGELIVAARVPVQRGPQDYLKVGVRNAMVIAVASLAMAVDLDARTIGVGLGSVGPTPLAADDATTWLAGRVEWGAHGITARPADAAEFGRRVADAARAIDDHRSTAEYREHAIGVLARRALRRAARWDASGASEQAGEGDGAEP